MKDEIEKRFIELLKKGGELRQAIPSSHRIGLHHWVPREKTNDYQSWIGSVANIIQLISTGNSFHLEELKRIITNIGMQGISSEIYLRLYGLLESAKEEWDRGLLRKVEYIFVASTFDDFLDHAADYHKGNKKLESSVLASAVLEDTINRIATKNGITPSGMSLEPLIDELVKNNVFTAVKAKRIKGYTSVRNHALHAEWDSFDIRDVGEMINGIRELIEHYI